MIMKKTKILSFMLVFMMLVSVFATSVQATSTYTNQTAMTNTNFYIDSTGMADVSVCYSGVEGLTTQAKITITISKRSFLFFWNEVVTTTLYSTEIDYSYIYSYQLSSKGTYKCEVEYCVSGTGGADDILTFEDTATY